MQNIKAEKWVRTWLVTAKAAKNVKKYILGDNIAQLHQDRTVCLEDRNW